MKEDRIKELMFLPSSRRVDSLALGPHRAYMSVILMHPQQVDRTNVRVGRHVDSARSLFTIRTSFSS